MLVEVDRRAVHPQAVDPGLLGRLAVGRGQQRAVTRLAVPAEREPPTGLAVQVEQHPVAVGGQHERARRQVVGEAGALGAVGVRVQVVDVAVAQPRLPPRRRGPGGQLRQGLAVQRHVVLARRVGRVAQPAVEQVGEPGVEVRLAELVGRRGVLAEAQRVVEVGVGGQQVGVRPHAVAGLGALAGAQRAPQRGGVAQPARPQLEADQRREGLLGRATRGPAAAYRLLELARGGHPLGGGLADDLVDPALHQGEGDLEPLTAPPAGRGDCWRSKSPPSKASCIDAGLVGSIPRSCSSMASVLISMPRA